jgi:ribonuclease Z
MSIENVLLYHTEDKNLANRKELYTKEAKEYYSGKVYVPEDLEVIEL